MTKEASGVVLAGLKSRTLTAIGRAMPRPLLKKLIGEEWHEELVMSVYEAMKALRRDTERSTIRRCVDLVKYPYADDVAALGGDEPSVVARKIVKALQRLEKRSNQQPKRAAVRKRRSSR